MHNCIIHKKQCHLGVLILLRGELSGLFVPASQDCRKKQKPELRSEIPPQSQNSPK